MTQWEDEDSPVARGYERELDVLDKELCRLREENIALKRDVKLATDAIHHMSRKHAEECNNLHIALSKARSLILGMHDGNCTCGCIEELQNILAVVGGKT